jgi:hypothetical protein
MRYSPDPGEADLLPLAPTSGASLLSDSICYHPQADQEREAGRQRRLSGRTPESNPGRSWQRAHESHRLQRPEPLSEML